MANSTVSNSQTRSSALAARARRSAPGGVHSNVRMNAPMRFFERGEGAWLFDVDGRDYVDHLLGQGPNFLGHAPPEIVDAVAQACRRGTLFGGQHELEIEASEAVLDAVGWAEAIRFGVTGTEAVHAAVRAARAYTGRSLIVRFEGHYHGWLDDMLVAEREDGWGPASAGQHAGALADQLLLPWNDADAVTAAFDRLGDRIAAIITEPMMVNVGAIQPRAGYLQHLRDCAHAHGALLILDEVICGFRLARGGGAERFGVEPDLATYGKAVAGGWPVSAFVGRSEIMDPIGTGAVNHSGTFNSCVPAMAAVVATMTSLRDRPPYAQIEQHGTALMEALRGLSDRRGLGLRVDGLPAAFHVSFRDVEAHDAAALRRASDAARYVHLAEALVDHGVWVAGRGVWYTSAAHGQPELVAVAERADAAVEQHLQTWPSP